jgi:ABC-type lipoprotein release transport system permease subunit
VEHAATLEDVRAEGAVLAAAVVASSLPALRAARIDVIQALRAD